jgi:hypothetical protein
MTTPTSLEERVRRLEDHTAIVTLAVGYAAAVDAADWGRFRGLFTDSLHVDFSQAGMPAADFSADDFVAFARQGLEVWDARQHLSTNHEVDFDADDPDRAVLRSYMFAQHHMQGAPTFVMHGSYEHTVIRTSEGWRIGRLVQNLFWMDAPPAAMVGE